MPRGQPYNGHKNWSHWNVSLWIGNDEGLYRLALDAIKERPTNLLRAADLFIMWVGVDRTPDGAHYSRTAVAAALKGLQE